MIKLYSLLKESKEEQKPYMYSPVGFSCAVCEYYYKEDGKHMCKNQDYADYMGTNELVDEEGEQIQDPTKWCSNWFEPKEQDEETIDEMAETDKDYIAVLSKYESGSEQEKSIISSALGLGQASTIEKVKKELRGADKDDIEYIKGELGIEDLDEACWKGYIQKGTKKKGNRTVPNCVRVSEAKKKQKINPKYLTKDASAMKKEINRVKKLKDDDPSAYGKWDADYKDRSKSKKYDTKKSAATKAYEKRFGKKEK